MEELSEITEDVVHVLHFCHCRVGLHTIKGVDNEITLVRVQEVPRGRLC